MDTKPIANDQEAVHQAIREGYGKIANETSGGCCGGGVSCCGSSPQDSEKLARELGYSVEELQSLPEGSNMGLSCGNPAALAALQAGEVVLDLGCGGGFDVFVAGRKVGSTGRVIGVDMTAEMLAKARKNQAIYRDQSGLDNVEFRLGEIEHLPVADSSVDVVISNCVINLSPDKPQVWQEIHRVLKPGGRIAVSDMALLKPLPPEVLNLVTALVGCVAGAVLISDTEQMARKAGLTDIALSSKPEYVSAMMNFEDPLYKQIIGLLPKDAKPSDYLASVEVKAGKKVSSVNYTPEIKELVAVSAAVAANCEPCLKFHYHEAKHMGVTTAVLAKTIETAMQVKDSPHQAVLRLASRMTGLNMAATPDRGDPCCAPQNPAECPGSPGTA